MERWIVDGARGRYTVLFDRGVLLLQLLDICQAVSSRILKSCHIFTPTAPPPPRKTGLVRRQPLHHGGHLLVGVYSKAAGLGHAGQLHVLGVELLLHDLLERLEHERLGVGDGEGLEGPAVSTGLHT